MAHRPKHSSRTGRAAALTVYFQFLRHKVELHNLTGRVVECPLDAMNRPRAVLRHLPAADHSVTADASTLLAADYLSGQPGIVDLTRLPWQPRVPRWGTSRRTPPR